MLNMKNYDKNHPIILGLAGKAATGKTSVAEKIVPKGAISTSLDNLMWDHIFFALPLYELASIKRTVEGINKNSRQLFAIHETLYDLFGNTAIGSIPNYPDFVDLVQEIHQMAIEPEGVKARTFLQKAGDLCRGHDADCFAKWAINKAKKIHRVYESQIQEEDQSSPTCIIISDVRFYNEAKHILQQPNGIIVCYEASDKIRNDRMLQRDGKIMTPEQSSHVSEKQIDLIKEVADAIIDTNNMSIEDQTNKTIDQVNTFLKQYA